MGKWVSEEASGIGRREGIKKEKNDYFMNASVAEMSKIILLTILHQIISRDISCGNFDTSTRHL